MMMNIKLFFKLVLITVFLIVNHDIKAQNCQVELDVVIEGSQCTNNGKAKITVNTKASEGSVIDASKAVYTVSSPEHSPFSFSGNTTELVPGNYIIYAKNILCNGSTIGMINASFVVKLELKITKAEYKRCSASYISVAVDVLGGKGPYTCKLFDGNTVIETVSSPNNAISFSAQTSSSDLNVEVTDDGCTENSSVKTALETNFKLEQSIIEGDKTACKNGNIKLSVKNAYSGSNLQWRKGNTVKSTSNTLQISNITEAEAGEYTFSMTFDGCDIVYSETFTIEVGGPPVPNVSPANLCLNAGEVSLSNYASATSTEYTLVWYKSDTSYIGETAPKFNPNLLGTTKYFVSQKNSSGCESLRAGLTVVVEKLPVKIGENNIIFCTSENAKPQIRIVNAGVYTYNLYTDYLGGTKIGSGTAVNDTAIIETNQNLIAGKTYFIETQNARGCVSENRTVVNITIKDSWILGPKKVCFGDNLSLSADYVGGQIVWTKPDKSTYTGKILNIDDMEFANAGVYSLLIKEPGLGCTMKDEIHVAVTQPAPPTVSVDSFRYFQNETAKAMTATAKTGCTLKWYDPEGKSIPDSHKPATDKVGVFVYHVSQDSLGCESPKVPITIIVGEIPVPVPASDINVCIASQPVIHIDNTIKDYKYTVYYKDGVIAEGKGNGSSISLASKVSISENAELGITVSDLYNVSSERTKVNLISVNNLIDMQNSTPLVCDGSTGKLTAVNITGAVYEWKTLKGIVAEQSVTILNATSADAGIYTLAVTTSGCPVAQQTIELKVEKPAKPVTTKEVYYCKSDVANELKATALAGYKLVWFDESQTQLSGAPMPNTSVVGVSTYYVKQISISDERCSSDREKITVVVEDKPEAVVLASVNVCSAPGNTQPVLVRIPTSSEGYVYSLYSQEIGGLLAGRAVSAGDDLPVDIEIKDGDVNSIAIYYLEVTNKSGCMSERTPLEIVVTKISVSPNELPPYQVDELYSHRLTTNAPNPKYEIVEGYLPIGFTLSSMGDITGTATEYADPSVFTVEVTSSLGCSVKKEYSIKSELLTSKMFSPNGDGINDIFMKGYRVVIFDRLGRKLFSGDNGWDGTYHGKVMPEDVYYYILYYKDKDGTEKRVTSYVTLIKTM
jgi:gliding motility-associated-like protein